MIGTNELFLVPRSLSGKVRKYRMKCQMQKWETVFKTPRIL